MSEEWLAPVAWAAVTLGLGAPLLGAARWAGRPAVAAALAGLLALEATALAATGQTLLAWAPAAALAAGHVLTGRLTRRRSDAAAWARREAALLLTGGPFAALGMIAIPYFGTAPDAVESPPPVMPQCRVESDGSALPSPVFCGSFAHTDRGGMVPLLTCPEALVPEQLGRAHERVAADHYPSATLVAGPDPGCNCHGWLFAGGRFWIDNSQVDVILRDNGYALATRPQCGDIVIYRDPSGAAIHSGLVCDVAADTLVESKWGAMHRFRHPVAAQPFSDHWSYYHANRPTHQLLLPQGEPRAISGQVQ